MKTEFSTPFESWLVIALIAILSAPILGVVVSGCVKKEEVMLSGLAQSAGSFGEGGRLGTAEDHSPAPKGLPLRQEAPRAEAKKALSAGKTVSKLQDEFAGAPGKETGRNSKPEGEKAKSLDPETSPALQSARRLLKIFEATENALPDTEEEIEANKESREGK